MPEEDGSNPPSRNPDSQSLGQDPRANLPEQSVMGNKPASRSNQQEEDSEKPTGRVHWINHATFYLSVILAILTGGTIRVYYLQLNQMIVATQATQAAAYDACMSAKIARQTLIDYEAGAADAHSVATGTIAQASAAISSESGILSLGTGLIPRTTPALPTEFPKYWNKFGIAFTYGNVGKAAVRSLRLKFTVQLLPQGIEPDPRNPNTYYDSARAAILQPGPAAATNPNIIDQNNKFVVLPDDKQLEDFQSGNTYITSFGRADYVDTFGVKHWQRFCGYFDNSPAQIPKAPAKPKLRHPQCTDFNEADSNLLYPIPQTPSAPPASVNIVEEITCTAPKR
ncbi:MAG: hypothetical protein WAN65_26255 [Candidatus Sulfotelmatobacter sp.]